MRVPDQVNRFALDLLVLMVELSSCQLYSVYFQVSALKTLTPFVIAFFSVFS